MGALTDHDTHEMAGIRFQLNSTFGPLNLHYSEGISLLLASKVMLLPSTGREVRYILNCNYVRHVAILRSCIKTHSQIRLIEHAH